MPLSIGNCSWNYDSWVGLVYPEPRAHAADYLADYAARYRMVEVDSWFYRMPMRRDAEEYAAAVDDDFRFICKAPRDISLTHFRSDQASANPAFLSPDLYKQFLENLEPLGGKLGAVILEFEYLNKTKMPSRAEFMDRLGAFLAEAPKGTPLAVECRNGSWLDRSWYAFLARAGAAPVLSEKRFLPPVARLGAKCADLFGRDVVFRLLGGDRAEIETAAGGRWDRIIEPKSELGDIAALARDLSASGRRVWVDVNNHYEGSAPLTIDRFLGFESA